MTVNLRSGWISNSPTAQLIRGNGWDQIPGMGLVYRFGLMELDISVCGKTTRLTVKVSSFM